MTGATRRWRLALGLASACAAAGCTPRTAAPAPASKSTAILGGTADTTHDAVMALLQMETPTTAYACSGTTITQSGTSAYLLTAAHCVVLHDAMENIVLPLTVVTPAVMMVLPGPDWQTSLSQGRKLTVTAISVAPGYAAAAGDPNDLAIVRFTTSTPALPTVPILEPADDTLAVGSILTLVGYGVTETGAQSSVRRTVDRPIETLTSQLLSYAQNDMKGQCNGDSGGPALTRVAGAERVAGVMVFSQDIPSLDLYCRLNATSVRVSAFASFVHSVVGVTPPPDAGAPVDAADAGDASPAPDAAPGGDAKLPTDAADAAPACGKLTDPRPACAACIASRCCTEAAVCGADPLCLGCGANPLPSCLPYPPSAILTACLATCAGNPCGVPLDAGSGQPDATLGDAGAPDASTTDTGSDAARPDATTPDAARPDAVADAPGDAAPVPDAGSPVDAMARQDARPADATADRTTDGGDLPPDSSGCGCAVTTRADAPWPALAWLIAGYVVRRRLRASSRDRCGS
jgi:hypothetical protein